jgi:SAM-dependent methyltransferase
MMARRTRPISFAFADRCGAWAELGNPLPFRDEAVGAFYSHPVIEHLPDVSRHFADLFRCRAPGGVFRVGGPNGDGAIRTFVEADADRFTRLASRSPERTLGKAYPDGHGCSSGRRAGTPAAFTLRIGRPLVDGDPGAGISRRARSAGGRC